jgi:hypothetical protein
LDVAIDPLVDGRRRRVPDDHAYPLNRRVMADTN